MDLLSSGGMLSIFVVGMGIAAFVVFILRWVAIRAAGINVRDLLTAVTTVLEGGNVQEALSQCEETKSSAAVVVRAGILHRDDPPHILREALEAAGREAVTPLERSLGVLLALAYTAPLLGLLGTLWGLYETLAAINGNMQTHLVQAVDMTQGVARAISTAACGILVGMLIHVFHIALSVRVDRLVSDMESAASQMYVYFSKNKAGY